jgi:formate dehydrogenase
MAPKLKLAVTAGIGSDLVDLQAAIDRGITVAEVTYCNSISVSEHVVQLILSLKTQRPSGHPPGANAPRQVHY